MKVINNFLNTKEFNLDTLSLSMVSWITLHGITDIINVTKDKLFCILYIYAVSGMCVYYLNKYFRFILLLAMSLSHISKEINIFVSIMIHSIWFLNPKSCLIYLTYVHVPLHYYKVLTLNNFNTIIVPLYLINTYIIFKYKKLVFYNANTLWWVGPVAAHVLITDSNKL